MRSMAKTKQKTRESQQTDRRLRIDGLGESLKQPDCPMNSCRIPDSLLGLWLLTLQVSVSFFLLYTISTIAEYNNNGSQAYGIFAALAHSIHACGLDLLEEAPPRLAYCCSWLFPYSFCAVVEWKEENNVMARGEKRWTPLKEGRWLTKFHDHEAKGVSCDAALTLCFLSSD